MDKEKIETSLEIMTLINSKEWANDTLGKLERKYYELCAAIGVTEEDATEWLHEED